MLMMDWVKTARLLTTMDHDDSWVDKAGYSSLGGEFSEENLSVSQMSEFLEDLKEVKK